MAVYLSPGVFPVEIDLSALPTAVGPLLPAFIGTANRGPMNTPTFITSAAQYIDTFGTPFPQSYLGYAILAYMETGNACYVMRVGVEYTAGLADALAEVAIDVSGGRLQGWGRIPLFAGIDFGRINLRAVSSDNPVTFQAAAVLNVDYNDAALSTTDGPTQASLVAEMGHVYTGTIDDSYIMVITGAPTDDRFSPIAGATYQIVRNSDGEVVAAGELTDPSNNGTSNFFAVGTTGLAFKVVVATGDLDVNDTFVWDVVADNRSFAVSVEGAEDAEPVVVQLTGSYTTNASLLAALNTAVTSAYTIADVQPDFQFINFTQPDGSLIPQICTLTKGHRIQVIQGQAWSAALGTSLWAWDIPRSYLLGLDSGPFSITTQNNRVALQSVGVNGTLNVQFNLPVGINQSAATVANSINAAGTTNGQNVFNSFALTLVDGTQHLVIITSIVPTFVDHSLDTLVLLANYTNLKTLQFSEEFGFFYPYQQSYRGFQDYRLALPQSSAQDPAVPQSCINDPGGDQCGADAAYYGNIVGWLVATTPGTWLSGYTASLQIATGLVGSPIGAYNLVINNGSVVVDQVQNVNFDLNSVNYVGNSINPGSPQGGVNGDSFVNWEPRPSYLNFDPTQPAQYEVRYPSPFARQTFDGTANGIPLDAAYSSELDAAIIGNPAISSGLYGFQNPDTYDINLLCIPGFSSGAVIGQALAMCEARGDVLFIVDPPFGLRPQQAVDWHNGMLLSDLTAAINSSYGALYWGWLQIFDQFSANNLWVPPSGHIAAVFSRTATVAEQWFAPAGLNRGFIDTALAVEYSPSQGERDLLYGSGNAVNPIVNFPQSGITVWGQRTLQRAQTALDRVNVRMLLIFIKKNLVQLLRNYVFEPNDSVLWSQVTNAINPFLSNVAARRGLTAFKVVCDATNNTPDRIDQNQLWVSVFLKPTRTVEFIVLNLVILQTGASFSAEEVLAAGGISTAGNSNGG